MALGRRRKLQQAVTKIHAAHIGVEGAISSREEDMAVGVGSRRAAGLPDSTETTVGGSAPNRLLLECVDIVGHDPAVIRPVVAVGCPADVDVPIAEKQTGALIISQAIERDSPSHRTVAAAGHSALNLNRTAELFGACGHVEGMQPLHERPALVLLLGDHIQGAGHCIYDGRSGDANLRVDVFAIYVFTEDSGDAGRRVYQALVPKWLRIAAGFAARVKGIDAVVLRCHINNAMNALPRDTDVWQIKGLGIDKSIHRLRENLGELTGVYIAECESGLFGIPPLARVVVVISRDRD